jgi:hypothetical protein
MSKEILIGIINTNEMHNGIGPPGFGAAFGIARFVPILIVIVWLGIGIRQ